MEYVFVGIGGFIGACLRFAINRVSAPISTGIPLGTLVSNVIAGLLIGFFIGLEQSLGGVSPKVRLFLTTGLLGGLSTFSAFSLETVTLFQTGHRLSAIVNISFNLGLSLLGVAAGAALAGFAGD